MVDTFDLTVLLPDVENIILKEDGTTSLDEYSLTVLLFADPAFTAWSETVNDSSSDLERHL